MQFRRNLVVATALVAGLGWQVHARGGVIGNAAVNFNDAGDLDNNFNHTATLPFSEADAVGIGPTRGLTVTGTTDSYATFKTSSLPFDVVGSQIKVSAFFHTGASFATSGEDRVLELNIAATDTSVVTGAHTGIGAKLEFNAVDGVDDVQIRFRRNNADVATSLNAALFDIQPNTWYKATFTATNQGAAAVIPSTMVLDSYGADGLALVSANVYSHSFDIPATDVSGDAAVNGAFRVRNGTRLYSALDNFEQSQQIVPEPASLGLIGLAGCLVLGVRRRRNA